MSRQVVVDHLYDERAGGTGGDLLPALQLLFGDCKSVATRTRVVVRFLLLEMIIYRVYQEKLNAVGATAPWFNQK